MKNHDLIEKAGRIWMRPAFLQQLVWYRPTIRASKAGDIGSKCTAGCRKSIRTMKTSLNPTKIYDFGRLSEEGCSRTFACVSGRFTESDFLERSQPSGAIQE
jgi:hypothetical protein